MVTCKSFINENCVCLKVAFPTGGWDTWFATLRVFCEDCEVFFYFTFNTLLYWPGSSSITIMAILSLPLTLSLFLFSRLFSALLTKFFSVKSANCYLKQFYCLSPCAIFCLTTFNRNIMEALFHIIKKSVTSY